jgi:hypothetical protein
MPKLFEATRMMLALSLALARYVVIPEAAN